MYILCNNILAKHEVCLSFNIEINLEQVVKGWALLSVIYYRYHTYLINLSYRVHA